MTDVITDSELPHGAPDKLYEHHRQQLSAMLDGALSPDAARFMLRRLQHDTELASCWERWQVCGDVLRGRRNALLPADFAQCVARAIANEQAAAPVVTAPAARPRWARWGGGAALAASVAVAALLVVRQTPSAVDPATSDPATRIVATSSPTPATSVEIEPDHAPVPPTQPAAPDLAVQLAATAAMAATEVPRRAAARRSRGQSQRAAIRTPARVSEAPAAMLAASNAPVAAPVLGDANPEVASAEADLFSAQALKPPNRPWPRAILPNFPAAGALTVDYGSSGAPSFYPFEPRVTGTADDGGVSSQEGAIEPPPQP